MVIYLYHWKIKLGKEAQFEKNWAIVTAAILKECGSYGSRLHLAENGEYFGYAQWPDVATRERCSYSSEQAMNARLLMVDAIESSLPTHTLSVKSDFLIHNM